MGVSVLEKSTTGGSMTTKAIVLIETRIERIENEVEKLRAAVEAGTYGPRGIVGDAVLVFEGQLKQIRTILNDEKVKQATVDPQLNTGTPLRYDNFLKEKNNFENYFVPLYAWAELREPSPKQEPYNKCMKANPVTFRKLADKLRMCPNSFFFSKRLYAAYVMMYPYAEKNEDLFGSAT